MVLLVLAIDTVLFRNLVLVSHLYAQNTWKQVGSVTGLGAVVVCISVGFEVLEIIRFDSVEVRDVLFHVLDYLDLFGMEVEPPFFGRGIKRFPFGGR